MPALATHKAGSAEAILRHCHRGLGATADFRAGRLSQKQQALLLDEVREYGRAWLRREFSQFFRHHGTWVDRALAATMRHHVARLFRRTGHFLRELITAGMMAVSGPAPLDEHDLAEIDRQADRQAVYLGRFRNEVELSTPPGISIAGAGPPPEPLSVKQVLARAELYSTAAWGDVLNHRRNRIIASGQYKRERRVHAKPMGSHEQCITYESKSKRGWVPIGSLSPIGDSECGGYRCDCYFAFR
jgi:hypothetical protein